MYLELSTAGNLKCCCYLLFYIWLYLSFNIYFNDDSIPFNTDLQAKKEAACQLALTNGSMLQNAVVVLDRKPAAVGESTRLHTDVASDPTLTEHVHSVCMSEDSSFKAQ